MESGAKHPFLGLFVQNGQDSRLKDLFTCGYGLGFGSCRGTVVLILYTVN